METNFEAIERAQESVARERLRVELERLSQDAEELLKATAGEAGEKTKEFRSKLAAALERARTTCSDIQDQTLATAKDAAKKADGMIREHPYESIGIAFGIGILLGAVITRK